jgi:nitrate/nitrite transporter NarK
MKDELRQALTEIAAHPATFGLFAAFARWWLGDRVGGWRALIAYAICSLLVAWAGSFYLADEMLTSGRRSFYLLLLAFIAKDLLTALASVAAQFRVDPFGVARRIFDAWRGGPKT